MDFTRRKMKGYFYVDPTGLISEEQMSILVDLCLEYNAQARLVKRRIKK